MFNFVVLVSCAGGVSVETRLGTSLQRLTPVYCTAANFAAVHLRRHGTIVQLRGCLALISYLILYIAENICQKKVKKNIHIKK